MLHKIARLHGKTHVQPCACQAGHKAKDAAPFFLSWYGVLYFSREGDAPEMGIPPPRVCLSECQLAFHSGVPRLKYLGTMPEHRLGCIINNGGFIPQPLCRSDVSGTNVPPQGYTGRKANWRPVRGVLQPLNSGRQSTRGQCPNTVLYVPPPQLPA